MFSAQQLSSTQEHMRLDPAMCPRNFYAQWVFLWSCAVETMTRSRFESSHSHALRHTDVSLFVPQGEKEDFKRFVSRIQVAYERSRAELSLLGRADMLPHEDTLVDLVYTKGLRSVTVKVQTMLRTTEHLTERDLTMVTVVCLYMRAAYRRDQAFSGIDAALRATAQPRQQLPQQQKVLQQRKQKQPPGNTQQPPAVQQPPCSTQSSPASPRCRCRVPTAEGAC